MESRGLEEVLELEGVEGNCTGPQSLPTRAPGTTSTGPLLCGAYSNQQGGFRSSSLWVLAEAIFKWDKAMVLSLSVVHLKGELNQLADVLSRKTLREGDWVLNLQEDYSKMGGPMCGPLCLEGECEISPLLLEQVGNQGGCALSKLAFYQVLCLPPSRTFSTEEAWLLRRGSKE